MWYNDYVYPRQARISTAIIQKGFLTMTALLLSLPNLWDTLKNTLAPVTAFLEKALVLGFPFVNAFAILMAGVLCAGFYGKLKTYARRLLLRCLGLAVILFGISQLWDAWFVLDAGQLETNGTLLSIVAVLIGWLFGEALMLDKLLARLGIALSRFFAAKPTPAEIAKAKKTEPDPVLLAAEKRKLQDTADGFVIATTLCGFSSLLFTGFLEGRMQSDPVPMLIKLAFDVILVCGLATVYGNGVSFAAIPTLLIQLAFWLVDAKWGDILTVTLLGADRALSAAIAKVEN